MGSYGIVIQNVSKAIICTYVNLEVLVFICLLGYCLPLCTVVSHWRCCLYGRLLSELLVTWTSVFDAVLYGFCLIVFINLLHFALICICDCPFAYVICNSLLCCLWCYGSRWNSEALRSMNVFCASLCRDCSVLGCMYGYMLHILGSPLWGSLRTIISNIM
jgi:hypothetical protein